MGLEVKGTSNNLHFIPTDVTTSYSTKLSNGDSLVAGYAALGKIFCASFIWANCEFLEAPLICSFQD